VGGGRGCKWVMEGANKIQVRILYRKVKITSITLHPQYINMKIMSKNFLFVDSLVFDK
jgi:hypothetical protein